MNILHLYPPSVRAIAPGRFPRRLLAFSAAACIHTIAFAGSVEIKYVVHTDDVDGALKYAGQSGADIEERNIYFIEKNNDLGKNGLILRLREKTGKQDDSTVKLRGDKAKEVKQADFPAGVDEEAKLEADEIVGNKATWSFSITAKQGKGAIAELRAGKRKLGQLFSKAQEAFLSHYAPGIAWQTAPLLGPVQTQKWDFTPPGFSTPLTAELWILSGCKESRVLEISVKTDETKSAKVTEQLKEAMKAGQIRPAKDPESKTKMVIDCYEAK